MTRDRMQKVTSLSLADQAREMIRNAIVQGSIQPEERLTIERIAAELGISRTPVREALKSLEAEGMVKLLPHRGAVVLKFDEAEIHDRYSVRANLEGYAGEQACRLAPDQVAAALAANCDEAEALIAAGVSADDLDKLNRLVELNAQFHAVIYNASGSQITVRLLATLAMPTNYRIYHWSDVARQKASLQFHREIVDAFREHKPKRVRKLLEDHLTEARDFILKRSS